MSRILSPSNAAYEILECIGQGSAGRVHRAIRVSANGGIRQTVAVKFLNRRTPIEDLRREFESLRQVTSPRCVRVWACEHLGDAVALILDHVEGLTLADLLGGSRLAVEEAEYLIHEIGLGLLDLARAGIHHGDLSLTNVMIDVRGTVRLLDFGMANCALDRRRLTPAFAAPECCAGEPATWASDLYSLGKVAERIWPEPLPHWLQDLTSPQPSARQFSPQERTCPEGLIERVQRLIRQRQEGRQLTTEVGRQPGAERLSRPVWLRLASLAVVLLAVSGSPVRSAPGASLRVRSNFGVQIKLNERHLGFAPLDVTQLSPGRYELKWRHGAESGALVLTLRPGDNIVIDDSWFFSRPPGGEFEPSRRYYLGNHSGVD